MTTRMNAEQVIDHLTYSSYRHSRRISPQISPERWALIFPNASALEARFQADSEVASIVEMPLVGALKGAV